MNVQKMLAICLRVAVICLALAFYLLNPAPANAQFVGQKPEFIKVTDRVYSATGYSLGNINYVITDKSVVVIDTSENVAAANQTLAELRKITQLPISYIIYTHYHPDHVSGAKAFQDENTKIIAQQRMPSERDSYNLLSGYIDEVKTVQYGLSLPEEERAVTTAVKTNANEITEAQGSGYIPPDILFEEEYKFEEGGVKFELYHTIGETIDHVMVWLPQEKVLFPGDLFYLSFPMLSNPMKPGRYIPEWADSVDRMRELKPAYIVPSHTVPLVGEAEIDTALANYAKAIRYVHDETVKAINKGQTLDQMRQQIHLPDELASLPYLQPLYGRVEWAINGIYEEYTGWYDLNPTHLNPAPLNAVHRALVEASGGSDALVKRTQQALQDNQPQLALEITDVILDAEPKNTEAKTLRVQALEQLALETKNAVELNIYLGAAEQYKE